MNKKLNLINLFTFERIKLIYYLYGDWGLGIGDW